MVAYWNDALRRRSAPTRVGACLKRRRTDSSTGQPADLSQSEEGAQPRAEDNAPQRCTDAIRLVADHFADYQEGKHTRGEAPDELDRLAAERRREYGGQDGQRQKQACSRPRVARQAVQRPLAGQRDEPRDDERGLEELEVVQVEEAQRGQRANGLEGQADRQGQQQRVKEGVRPALAANRGQRYCGARRSENKRNRGRGAEGREVPRLASRPAPAGRGTPPSWAKQRRPVRCARGEASPPALKRPPRLDASASSAAQAPSGSTRLTWPPSPGTGDLPERRPSLIGASAGESPYRVPSPLSVHPSPGPLWRGCRRPKCFRAQKTGGMCEPDFELKPAPKRCLPTYRVAFSRMASLAATAAP